MATHTVDVQGQRFELALQSSRLGLWDWNMRTGQTVFNARWAEIIGFTLAELSPTTIDTWMRFADPDDLTISNAAIESHISGATPFYDVTVRMLHRDGHVVWVHDRGRVVEWDHDGAPVRMVGTHEDVSARVLAELALEESEKRLSMMFNEHDAVMLLIDPATGEIVDANPSAVRFYGYCKAELTAMRIDQINMLPHAEVSRHRAQALTGNRFAFIFPHRLASGEIRHVEVHSSPLEDAGRRLLFSIITDVTEREANEARLREAAAVFDNITEAVILSDERGVVRRVNPAFEIVTGWRPSEIVGRAARSISGRMTDPADAEAVRGAHQTGLPSRAEIPIRHPDGSQTPALVTTSPILGPMGEVSGFVTLIADMAERVKTERDHIDRAANYDALTGLPNRTKFTELLAIELERLSSGNLMGALLFVDIDRFKDVNDSYGHAAGDVLLTTIAERLRSLLQPGDLLARFGGNEFALFLDRVATTEEATQRGLAVQNALAPACDISDQAAVFVTACLGVTLVSAATTSTPWALQAGDAALHEAKTAGPGTIRTHTQDHMVESRTRLSTETRLRQGWENNELSLRYQPQIDAQTGRVVGAEALLTWVTPEGERISPAVFIPIAERMGLIGQIGSWVLQQACLQGTTWDQEGLPPLTMSVNVSAKQLRDGRLPQEVAASLRDAAFPADRLRLELTESALLAGGEATLELLDALESKGVQLSIDDFGTGYSSFAYLRRFPLDEIKVDRSFVMDLETSADDRAICSAILALGHGLGLRVVAEGVETPGQLAFVRSHGGDLFQGFLVSPPIDPKAFADLVRGRL